MEEDKENQPRSGLPLRRQDQLTGKLNMSETTVQPQDLPHKTFDVPIPVCTNVPMMAREIVVVATDFTHGACRDGSQGTTLGQIGICDLSGSEHAPERVSGTMLTEPEGVQDNFGVWTPLSSDSAWHSSSENPHDAGKSVDHPASANPAFLHPPSSRPDSPSSRESAGRRNVTATGIVSGNDRKRHCLQPLQERTNIMPNKTARSEFALRNSHDRENVPQTETKYQFHQRPLERADRMPVKTTVAGSSSANLHPATLHLFGNWNLIGSSNASGSIRERRHPEPLKDVTNPMPAKTVAAGLPWTNIQLKPVNLSGNIFVINIASGSIRKRQCLEPLQERKNRMPVKIAAAGSAPTNVQPASMRSSRNVNLIGSSSASGSVRKRRCLEPLLEETNLTSAETAGAGSAVRNVQPAQVWTTGNENVVVSSAAFGRDGKRRRLQNPAMPGTAQTGLFVGKVPPAAELLSEEPGLACSRSAPLSPCSLLEQTTFLEILNFDPTFSSAPLEHPSTSAIAGPPAQEGPSFLPMATSQNSLPASSALESASGNFGLVATSLCNFPSLSHPSGDFWTITPGSSTFTVETSSSLPGSVASRPSQVQSGNDGTDSKDEVRESHTDGIDRTQHEPSSRRKKDQEESNRARGFWVEGCSHSSMASVGLPSRQVRALSRSIPLVSGWSPKDQHTEAPVIDPFLADYTSRRLISVTASSGEVTSLVTCSGKCRMAASVNSLRSQAAPSHSVTRWSLETLSEQTPIPAVFSAGYTRPGSTSTTASAVDLGSVVASLRECRMTAPPALLSVSAVPSVACPAKDGGQVSVVELENVPVVPVSEESQMSAETESTETKKPGIHSHSGTSPAALTSASEISLQFFCDFGREVEFSGQQLTEVGSIPLNSSPLRLPNSADFLGRTSPLLQVGTNSSSKDSCPSSAALAVSFDAHVSEGSSSEEDVLRLPSSEFFSDLQDDRSVAFSPSKFLTMMEENFSSQQPAFPRLVSPTDSLQGAGESPGRSELRTPPVDSLLSFPPEQYVLSAVRELSHSVSVSAPGGQMSSVFGSSVLEEESQGTPLVNMESMPVPEEEGGSGSSVKEASQDWCSFQVPESDSRLRGVLKSGLKSPPSSVKDYCPLAVATDHNSSETSPSQPPLSGNHVASHEILHAAAAAAAVPGCDNLKSPTEEMNKSGVGLAAYSQACYIDRIINYIIDATAGENLQSNSRKGSETNPLRCTADRTVGNLSHEGKTCRYIPISKAPSSSTRQCSHTDAAVVETINAKQSTSTTSVCTSSSCTAPPMRKPKSRRKQTLDARVKKVKRMKVPVVSEKNSHGVSYASQLPLPTHLSSEAEMKRKCRQALTDALISARNRVEDRKVQESASVGPTVSVENRPQPLPLFQSSPSRPEPAVDEREMDVQDVFHLDHDPYFNEDGPFLSLEDRKLMGLL